MVQRGNVKFSICIPYAENELFLREALKSLDRTVSDSFEVIVSQDRAVSKELEEEVSGLLPVRWLHGPRSGMVENWNFCVDNARGEFIIFLHSDDQFKKNYFQIIEKLQKAEPDSAAWFCNVDIIDESGRTKITLIDFVKGLLTPKQKIIVLQGDKGLMRLLRGCFIYCPTVCFRTLELQSFKFDSTKKMVADLDLYARMLIEGRRISGSREVGYRYRRHSRNTSLRLTKNLVRFSEELQLYRSIHSKLKDLNWSGSALQARIKLMPRLHILYELTKSLIFLEISRLSALTRLLVRG